MGFFGRITNKVTHGQDLKERIQKIEDYNSFLLENDKIMMSNVTQLYELRKKAFHSVQGLNVYVKKLPNHPLVLEEGCIRALSFMENIKQAEQFENQYSSVGTDIQATRGGGIAAAGAVAGTLTATVGPTAAMALATTFGTASTGAAISTLGGAAATNAALAWLGGGALAASGGGMYAGSALLAALGPIGISIGVISLGLGGALIRRKNDKKIKELDKLINDLDIDSNIRLLESKGNRLKALKKKTEEILHKVDNASLPKRSADYDAVSFPRELLFSLVDDAKLLGKMSGEAIQIGK